MHGSNACCVCFPGKPSWAGPEVCLHPGHSCHALLWGEGATEEDHRVWEEQQHQEVHVRDAVHKGRQKPRRDPWTVQAKNCIDK